MAELPSVTAGDSRREVASADWFHSNPKTHDLLAAFERAGSDDPKQSTHSYQAPSLARAEWEHIQRVLSDCGGNVSEAARRLGIHRRSLQRKLQKFAPE